MKRSRMTESDCYHALYGNLMLCVPHYKNRSIFTVPLKSNTIYITIGSGGGGGGKDGSECISRYDKGSNSKILKEGGELHV